MYYDAAREMALNNGEDFHLAALLWRRGKLIRIGINGRESKLFQRYYSKDNNHQHAFCAHAEMDALTMAQPGDYLEVLRWTKDGNLANSHPCRFCRKWIRRTRVQVRFINQLGEWEKLIVSK